MKYLAAALTIVFLCVMHTGDAQSFNDLNNKKGDNAFTDKGFQVFARYTHVNAKYTEPYGGITFNGSFRIDRIEKGEVSYHLESPTLGDFIFLLFNASKIHELTTEQAYGSGFFGWHQVYWNVVVKDRLLISPGISLGDYIYASKRKDGKTLEPAGYYFHLGPAVKGSYVINDDFWVDGFLHYDIAFRATTGSISEKIEGYPKPGFINVAGYINHVDTGLFGGFRVNHLIDRGSNKDSASRVDISIGVSF